jgi:hypothetical protein
MKEAVELGTSSSPNILRVIKSGRMRWGHVEVCTKFLSENQNVRDLVMDKMILLN